MKGFANSLLIGIISLAIYGGWVSTNAPLASAWHPSDDDPSGVAAVAHRDGSAASPGDNEPPIGWSQEGVSRSNGIVSFTRSSGSGNTQNTDGRAWQQNFYPSQQGRRRASALVSDSFPEDKQMSNTLLKHVTLLVVADKGSQDFLRAAQCTYMATLDPAQIIFVSDFPLPEVGGCGLPVSNRIRVVSAVDYLEVLKTVERSKKVLLPWVLVVKPWTFVHPGHLEAYLEERGSQNPEVYVGRVRNATSELAALSQMPHVAYEYGILMRAWAAVLVGKDKPEFEGFRSNMRHDFHTVRVASAFLSGVSS